MALFKGLSKKFFRDLSSWELLMATILFYFLSWVVDRLFSLGNETDLISGGLGTIGLICLLMFVVSLFRKKKEHIKLKT